MKKEIKDKWVSIRIDDTTKQRLKYLRKKTKFKFGEWVRDYINALYEGYLKTVKSVLVISNNWKNIHAVHILKDPITGKTEERKQLFMEDASILSREEKDELIAQFKKKDGWEIDIRP